MKVSRFVKFLKNGVCLFLVCGLLLGISLISSGEELVKAIRRTDQWPPYMDPAIASDFLSSNAYTNIYDTLIFPNQDGSLKPWLAKSWEISDDGLTYIFELRQGVKFHNGDELTAEDVVFSLQRMITLGEGWGFLFIPFVKETKALDKYKAQITLKQPLGPFLGVLTRLFILNKNQVMANITPGGSYGEMGDYGKEWLVTHDAGSGPYKLKEIKMQEYFVLEQFDDYWDGWDNKDAPQYVKWIGATEPVTVRTLMSRGELELTDQWQTPENLAAMSQLPNVKVSNYFGGQLMFVMINNKKPPTDDVHFRKALAYCVDKQQIIDSSFPGSRPVNGPVTPDILGYNSNLKPYTFDLEKAEAELKQSPYYGKLDQYPVQISPPAEGGPSYENIALMIQANAAKIGIKVDVVKIPWGTMVANMATLQTTPAVVLMTASDYLEAGSMLKNRYHSSSCGTIQQGEWLQDPEIDKIIDDALATTDQKERFQKYYAIQEKIVDLCPSIFLFETAIRQAYRNDYVVFPPAEVANQGGNWYPISGYNSYFRDFKVFPEKAQQPYTPYKP